MRKLILLLLIPLFLFVAAAPIQAAAKAKAKGPALSASIAKSKRSVAVTFSGLTNVKKIKYQLTYDSNKGAQGAGGTISLKKGTSTLSRSVLLGTCSHGVCSYHTNIKNAKLSVDFTLTTGGVVSYEKRL